MLYWEKGDPKGPPRQRDPSGGPVRLLLPGHPPRPDSKRLIKSKTPLLRRYVLPALLARPTGKGLVLAKAPTLRPNSPTPLSRNQSPLLRVHRRKTTPTALTTTLTCITHSCTPVRDPVCYSSVNSQARWGPKVEFWGDFRRGVGTLNGGWPSISGGLGSWLSGTLLRTLLICICQGPAHG